MLNEVIKEKFPIDHPKITLVIVNKRINQRFFEHANNVSMNSSSSSIDDSIVNVKNPPCGTIVDCDVVCNNKGEKLYDFFLVSQTAT